MSSSLSLANPRRVGAFAVAALAISISHAAAQVVIRGFGSFPGTSVGLATDVAADGSTVLGLIYAPTPPNSWVMRWTWEGGAERLVEPPELLAPVGFGLSGDGSVIVGQGSISNAVGFRWTRDTGYVILTDRQPTGVSDDGAYDFGRLLTPGFAPYRWSQSGGFESLGASGTPEASSADGSVVTGTDFDGVATTAWRWTAATGQVGLGALPDGWRDSFVRDVSADGTTIVGNFGRDFGSSAYRWTESAGYEMLAALSDNAVSVAYGVAADRLTTVGLSIFDNASVATIWLPDGSAHELGDYLTSLGADLEGWTLQSATSISDDGLTICGSGVNPLGRAEAYVVHIPTPGAASAVVLLVLRGIRRRR